MKICLGMIFMVLSLLCIITVVVRVTMGVAGLWSVEAVGAYVFHPLTMILGLWLLKPHVGATTTTEAPEGGA